MAEAGNYSDWLAAKAERLGAEKRANATVQRQLTEELEWVRSRAKGQQKKGKARMRRYEDLVQQVCTLLTLPSGDSECGHGDSQAEQVAVYTLRGASGPCQVTGSNKGFRSHYLSTSGFRRLEREHVLDRGRSRNMFPCAGRVARWSGRGGSLPRPGGDAACRAGGTRRRLVRAVGWYPLSGQAARTSQSGGGRLLGPSRGVRAWPQSSAHNSAWLILDGYMGS